MKKQGKEEEEFLNSSFQWGALMILAIIPVLIFNNSSPGFCRTLPLEKRIVLEQLPDGMDELLMGFEGEKIVQYSGYLDYNGFCLPFYEDPNLSQSTDVEIEPQILKNPLAHQDADGNVAIQIGSVWAPLPYFYGTTDGQQEILRRRVRYAPMSGSTK